MARKPYTTRFKLFYSGLAFLSAFAGAQSVHTYYKPLAHFEEEVRRQKELILAERAAASASKSSPAQPE